MPRSFRRAGGPRSAGTALSWTPATPGNLISWHTSLAGITLGTGSDINSWADQSGNGHTLTAGVKPQYSSTGWSASTAGITFSSSQYFICSDSGLGQYVTGTNVVYTIAATVKFTNANFPTLAEWSDSGISSIAGHRTSNAGKAQIDRFALGAATAPTNVIWNAKTIVFITCDSSGVCDFWNGSNHEINGASLPGALTADRLLVGNNWNVSNPLGLLADIAIYSKVFTSTDRSNYTSWSNARYV